MNTLELRVINVVPTTPVARLTIEAMYGPALVRHRRKGDSIGSGKTIGLRHAGASTVVDMAEDDQIDVLGGRVMVYGDMGKVEMRSGDGRK